MADILTPEFHDLLSEEARSRDDVEKRVDLAEMIVVGKYKRSHEGSLAWYWDGGLDPTLDTRLWGWEEDANGDVDVQASDDELIRRLRLVIASVVDWSLDYETTAHLDRETVGSKSVSYSDAPTIPTRLFRPLDPYDERQPFCGF